MNEEIFATLPFTTLPQIQKITVKISTPSDQGSGFKIVETSKIIGIATAYHVVEHANEWGQPIKIEHPLSKYSKLFESGKRQIVPYPDKDLAFIIFDKEELKLDGDVPDLVPPDKFLKQGVDIGWLGFPCVAPNNDSFFSGPISCYLDNEERYLVDGVAINGVSGGPAFFYHTLQRRLVICGVISEYRWNMDGQHPLPGVSVVTSVEPYQEILKELKSVSDAKDKSTDIQEELAEAEAPPQIDPPKKVKAK